MGRRKLEIKPIEDKSARQVTFSKRRNGMLKKAKELSTLCDAEIAVIVYSARGKLYSYCSSKSLMTTLQRHKNYVESESCPSNVACEEQCFCCGLVRFETERLSGMGLKQTNSSSNHPFLRDPNFKCQAQHSDYSQFITTAELLQIVERVLGEPSDDQHSIPELVLLESQLEAALIQTKTTKTGLLLDSISSLHEKEIILLEENRLLEEKIANGRNQVKKVILDLNMIPNSLISK